MGSLAGRVAFISGGARGMGAAEAKLFVREGASVAIADILDDRGRALAAEIEQGGGKAMYVHVDVSLEADWIKAAAAVRERFGRIDILVNNAGINDRQTIMGTSPESWRKVMAVNVDGTLFGLRAIAPIMRDGGGGAVVNIASTAGYSGNSFAAYATSKWAVRGLTKCAALEFAPWRIRVNAICPGLVLSELNTGQPYIEPMAKATPLGRAGDVEDIAKLALFLVSDASDYITGQDHIIDGGFTAGLVLPSAPAK